MEQEKVLNPLGSSSDQLTFLQEEKRRLGDLVASSGDSEGKSPELLAELQRVIKDIKSLKKQIKKQQATESEKRWFPETICAPKSILNGSDIGSITVAPANESHQQAVDAYVLGHPAGSIWHRPVVASFVQNTYQHQARYLCAFDSNGKVVGVLPVVQLNSSLFGNFLVSTPYFNYGGVLADHQGVAAQLIEEADRWRKELGAKHLELRHLDDSGLGHRQRTNKVTFWLPLPSRAKDLWDSFKPKLRAQIRRGDRELSGVVIGGVELLDEFYEVFSVNMRDLGTPVYSRRFFRNLLESLGSHAWLVVGRIDGRAVCCAFLTGYGERMEIPWASSLRRVSQTGVNMAMYWRILEFAMEKRYHYFDFGRCTPNSGTYRFKQQWGAQELQMHWDYILPEGGELPALNPDNPKFRIVIGIWQRLPVWVTKVIGPMIVKALP